MHTITFVFRKLVSMCGTGCVAPNAATVLAAQLLYPGKDVVLQAFQDSACAAGVAVAASTDRSEYVKWNVFSPCSGQTAKDTSH